MAFPCLNPRIFPAVVSTTGPVESTVGAPLTLPANKPAATEPQVKNERRSRLWFEISCGVFGADFIFASNKRVRMHRNAPTNGSESVKLSELILCLTLGIVKCEPVSSRLHDKEATCFNTSMRVR